MNHLSEDAMDEVLMGTASGDVEAHLAGCDLCLAKVAQFSAEIGMLSQATLAWNDARSNCMPGVAAMQAGMSKRQPVGWLAAAACSLVLIGGAVIAEHGGWMHRTGDGATDVSREADAPEIGNSELREDNALMAAIDDEIAPIASPLAAYQRPASRAAGLSKPSQRMEQ